MASPGVRAEQNSAVLRAFKSAAGPIVWSTTGADAPNLAKGLQQVRALLGYPTGTPEIAASSGSKIA